MRVIITARETILDVRIWRPQMSDSLTSKVDPRTERVKCHNFRLIVILE